MRDGTFAALVTSWLQAEGFRHRRCHFLEGQGSGHAVAIRSLTGACLVLNLLATPHSAADVLPASSSARLTDAFTERKQTLVHLWEDQWEEHGQIVRSRLLAKLGRSTRLMARKTRARRIDAATLEAFLLQNHLWGSTKARYRYGLFDADDELVAVASFSPRWKVRRHGGEPRASHELIRYCSRQGETVVGGITKLIAAFRRDAGPDEIVTVIDRDWGEGSGWASLGFQPLKQLPPVSFYIGPDGRRCHLGCGPNPHRRRLPAHLASAIEGLAEPSAYLADNSFYPVHDAGAERHLLILSPAPAPVAPAEGDERHADSECGSRE